MNFSAIPKNSLAGKLLRLPLKLLPADMTIPILQGPTKGMRWIVGSGDHGYWLGSYEIAFQRHLARVVASGATFFDIGAHVGYYTLLGSRLVGTNGHVYSFEPLPSNTAYIERHIKENSLENVTLMSLAISNKSGTAQFGSGMSTSTGRINADGELQVQTASLDELLDSGKAAPPDVMKIDVEGSEADVLEGAAQTIKAHRPKIFIATHGSVAHSRCVELLDLMDYNLEPLNAPGLEEATEIYASARSDQSQ